MEETKKIEVILDQADMDRVWRWTDARLATHGGYLAFYESLKDVILIRDALSNGHIPNGNFPTLEITPENGKFRAGFSEDGSSGPGISAGVARR